MTRTKEQIIENIIEYFNDNEDVFNDCIEELDGYNGYLGDDRYYDMENLNEYYADTEPMELLYRAFYGHDENYYTDEHGTEHYAEFNPNRNYFSYNGYGNLISSDYKDYSSYLDEYLIDELADNRADIWTIDHEPELTELFDELENAENEV